MQLSQRLREKREGNMYLAIRWNAFFIIGAVCPECSQRLQACKRECGRAFTSDCKSTGPVVLHNTSTEQTWQLRTIELSPLFVSYWTVVLYCDRWRLVGESCLKAPQRELHCDGRCASNQSQSGFHLKICMLIRKD
jgi:hypothetical protein